MKNPFRYPNKNDIRALLETGGFSLAANYLLNGNWIIALVVTLAFWLIILYSYSPKEPPLGG